jgi:hypothetical protein
MGEGGEGGTQTTPGAGGGDVGSPAVGQTGTGAAGGKGGEGGDFFGGGGGGGGWFGGGGGSGGNADDAGGGGGGSGHVDASVTESTLDSDVQEGSGLVTITYESATSTSLSSAPNPSSAGSTVTFTAMVTGTSPTGPVAFSDGGTPVPGCEGVELGTGGNTRTAVCQTASLGVGTHVIRALYKGDADNAASESTPLSQVVSGNGSSSATPTASSTSTTAAATPPPLLAPPTPVEPSNAFRFARVRVSARELRLRFDYPGDGTLDALVTTHRLGASAARLRPGPNRLSVGKLHDSASGAQTKTLRVRLTSRGRQILARRGKLPIRLSLVFTPTGGQSARQTHKYTVRG